MKIDTSILFKFVTPVVSIILVIVMFLLFSIPKSQLPIYLVYIVIVCVILSSIYKIAANQTIIILTKKSINKEIINLNTGVKYTTNDSIFYIGETSSTIFLYNEKNNSTIIINRANVVEIELIKKATIKIKDSKK